MKNAKISYDASSSILLARTHIRTTKGPKEWGNTRWFYQLMDLATGAWSQAIGPVSWFRMSIRFGDFVTGRSDEIERKPDAV